MEATATLQLHPVARSELPSYLRRVLRHGGVEPGHWIGSTAEALGLRGVVDGGDLIRVCAGRHPRTG